VQNNVKIILDVNIWVSAFISQKMLQHVQTLILQDGIDIIACQELLEELRQTMQRPKFKKYLSSERILLAIELVEQSAIFINSQSIVQLCRDNKDDYLLALAKDAQADFLLTGDNDLLVLNPFEKTHIIKLSEYLEQQTV
jgi:putative PIN family toxin of toxin-antitoxin system